MKADELIKKLTERGYTVDIKRYLHDYNATIHTVNIAGQLISIEYERRGAFIDDIPESACEMLFRIIKTGIRKGEYLVCDESLKDENGITFERIFNIKKWGGNETDVNTLYNNYCDCDCFYRINKLDIPDTLDYTESGYIISTCNVNDYYIVLAQLRLSGIKIKETNAIHDMRIYRGYTQQQLEERSGIARNKISLYEHTSDFKNVTIGNMKSIADALDCKIDDLI